MARCLLIQLTVACSGWIADDRADTLGLGSEKPFEISSSATRIWFSDVFWSRATGGIGMVVELKY